MKDHPEHAFMPIEKAKKICRTLVEVYGNTSIDIEGGERRCIRKSSSS